VDWSQQRSHVYLSCPVDDFGVQYTKITDVDRLIATLQTKNRLTTTDWTGTRYIGVTLD
jgi:hypothetical protein